MRTFIAIEISDELKRKLAELQQDLPKDGRIRLVKPDNVHVTLKFLGEIDESKVAEVKKAIESVKFEPFTIEVAGIGVFPSESFIRVVWVGAEDERLTKIAEELDRKIHSLGFRSEKFVSHLTITRVLGSIDLRDFLEKHKAGRFGQIEVKEIKLKKSTLTGEGPIYEDL